MHGFSAAHVQPLGVRSGLSLLQAQPTCTMNIHLSLTPLISLIAGILILIMPKLLNFIVAVYLILVGLIGLFGTGGFPLR